MRHAGGDSTFGFTKSGPTVHPATSATAINATYLMSVAFLPRRLDRRAVRHESLRHRLEQEEEQRREHNGDDHRRENAADHAGADRAQTVRTRAARDRERYAPKTEGERGHDDRSQPRPRGGERGLARGHAFAYVLDR